MTDQSKAIVTIGIRPCRPETGYGYIAAGEEVDQDIDVYKRQDIEIGEGAVIGAGTVMVKDAEPWGVYAGNPAKYIKKRILKK